MEGTTSLSEAQLYALENKTMEQDEALELITEIMEIVNGPDAPNDIVCYNEKFLPSVIIELCERIVDLEDTLDKIQDISKFS